MARVGSYKITNFVQDTKSQKLYKETIIFTKQPSGHIYRIKRTFEEADDIPANLEDKYIRYINLKKFNFNSQGKAEQTVYACIKPSYNSVIKDDNYIDELTEMLDPDRIREQALRSIPKRRSSAESPVRVQYIYNRMIEKMKPLSRTKYYTICWFNNA